MLSRKTGAQSLPPLRVQSSRTGKVARQTHDFWGKVRKKSERSYADV